MEFAERSTQLNELRRLTPSGTGIVLAERRLAETPASSRSVPVELRGLQIRGLLLPLLVKFHWDWVERDAG